MSQKADLCMLKIFQISLGYGGRVDKPHKLQEVDFRILVFRVNKGYDSPEANFGIFIIGSASDRRGSNSVSKLPSSTSSYSDNCVNCNCYGYRSHDLPIDYSTH